MARADIVEVGGSVEIIDNPPPDISINLWESDDHARIWLERTVLLDSPLEVNSTDTGMVFPGGMEGFIAPQEVASYMLRTDPVADTLVMLNGHIVFDQPILGVIWGQGRLNNTDDLLKRPGVIYNTNGQRGFEGVDWLEISADRRRVDFFNQTDNFTDDVRIITAVPEPGILSMLVLGGTALLRRRSRHAEI